MTGKRWPVRLLSVAALVGGSLAVGHARVTGDLVQLTGAAGRMADKPVGVCGEAASDPLLALVLTGLGVTSLSMAPTSVAEVRLALSRHTLAECRELAALALGSLDGVTARAAVAEVAEVT